MLDSRRPSSQSPKSRPAWINWFYNLPIGRKQLLALTLCEFIPMVGFGIGSTFVLTNSLRTQLLSQAKSELAVTETNYNIKVNQMGFGSRGQSDNSAVIAATKNHQNNQAPPADLQKILQNEVKARRMEYATLVGKDLRIIASANNSRSKETITSPKLVALIQQVLKDGNQIKANEIVSGDELSKEAPPLPDGFKPQDALIRYVVTPVRDPDNENVLGVLIFGDIANRKLPIVENTLNSFGGGYSAIYLRRADGNFSLATSLTKDDSQQSQIDVALADPAILQSAIAANGETVTQRLEINGQMHTVAVKALPNRIIETPERAVRINADQPTALIVRGTPEGALNQLLWESMQQQGMAFALAFVTIVAWTALFRRMVVKPIQNLQQTTEAFADGDRTVRAEIYAKDEVGKLAMAFNHMADSIRSSESALETEVSRQEEQTREARALSEITVRMRRSLNAAQILQTAITETRNFLKLDRVIVYQFQNPETLDALISNESIGNESFSVIHQSIQDPLGLQRIEQYQFQSPWVIQNSAAEPNDTYRQQAATLNTKAELIVPLKQNEQVTGLVCAQMCNSPHKWQQSEVNFLSQLVTQIGYALDQANLLQEHQRALQDAETRKDSLQRQIIQLLGEVQNVSAGDLTVHANTNAGDLGIVADFFNAIVENLRTIVVKVKQSSAQVNDLLSQNEGEVEQLAVQARQQAQETIRTLDSVEQMTQAMQAVAERAQKAAISAEQAAIAAESGETIMDSTVTSIYSLRATVEDATRKVKQLGESSQHIGRVVSLINDLATQTDLLAINASIEATRAGEHGRGFSIVANEIAELASRSANATREIAAIIETIQQQTGEVVSTMTHGATQAVESAHSARNAKQSLLHVVQVSQQMDQLVKSISETMAAQAMTSRSVTSLIQEVAEVSNRTSDSSLRVSDALRQTVGVAEELQSSVEMFKIQAGDRADI
ncbi:MULTISPECIES: methyl-accepting chemotaxis protein [Leptolyngbya]|uniref:methyl-accepting chemotaxis protein n=1 Tax=Leptolyngbya TaxID=47251 RepID=UPI00168548BA|nr:MULTISPECIES: methyl-accepting chemotaxis protein [unclassified Leptolyngbya]MBD1858551.1 HAMP domain-containing protein [Leptolyngbya sp. FACHB-1624]MBN8559741.1 HAMP domain-containing protein [Leptolyngbya sp. UWPOB_LEPTO1]MCY6491638.1 methyl-accepting chemotaxis protein [Leptolyngbya sp. GGD]